MTAAAGPEQSMLEREVMSWQDVGTGARDLAELRAAVGAWLEDVV